MGIPTLSILPVIASNVIRSQKIAGVKPIRLTKLEKFALCYVSGIPMSFGAIDLNNISKVTTAPVGIVWDGKEFKIYYRAGATA